MTLFPGRAEHSEHRTAEEPHYPSFHLLSLLDLFEGDNAAVASLLQAAIASIRSDAEAIVNAADAKDRRMARESAHRLKGTSGTIGVRRLFTLSMQIEEAVAQAPAPPAPLLRALREAVDVLGAEIADFSAEAE